MPNYTYECTICGARAEFFFHMNDERPTVVGRCAECTLGDLRRNIGADIATIGVRTDSIPGGKFVASAPLPSGFNPEPYKRMGAAARAAAIMRDTKVYSKGELRRRVETYNAGRPPDKQLAEVSIEHVAKANGIDVDRMKSCVKSGESYARDA